MPLVNESKPTTTLTNQTKIGSGETWASILTTWASETQTWGETASFIDNITKVTSSMANISKPA